jgi:NAD(P)-dependent dehydrogenase (short-subunit alcohol dehydrogenase family)
MSQSDLKGKWALILGASSGFGAATAREFAKNGVNIFGLHLDRGPGLEAAKKLAEELRGNGVEALYINMNIANPEKRQEAIAKMKESLGEHCFHMMMHSVAFGSLLPFISDDMNNTLTQAQVEMTLDVMANSLVYWTQDLWRAHLFSEGQSYI